MKRHIVSCLNSGNDVTFYFSNQHYVIARKLIDPLEDSPNSIMVQTDHKDSEHIVNLSNVLYVQLDKPFTR